MTSTDQGRRTRLIPLRILMSLIMLAATLGPAAARSHAAASGQEITLDVRTPTYQIDAHDVTVAGYSTIDTPGAPALPVTTVNPVTPAMTYLNQPVDIEVTGAVDGRFDPGDLVLFYAEPYQGRYMTQNVYRLT